MFHVKHEIDSTLIYNAIITGLEGGSYSSIGVVDGSTWEPAWRAVMEGKPEPFANVVCYDNDADPEDEEASKMRVRLTDSAIQHGVEVLAEKAPHHLKNILEEHDDVIDGDALMQCIVLGEIVYG